MGMFDSVYTNIKCPLCGDEREQEVQFKLSIGRAYSPELRNLRVGETVSHMPPIVLVEACGFSTFDCCEDKAEARSHDSLITFRFGVLTSVVYPLPEEHSWAPLPRGRLRARRGAASKERFDRAFKVWKVKRDAFLVDNPVAREIEAALSPNASKEEKIERALHGGLDRIGFAMAYPLMASIDYRGIARRMFFIGERTENYERASPGMPWKRREDRRLF